MKNTRSIPDKILDAGQLRHRVEQVRFLGKSIGFTNGVYDILHRGHIASLSEAAGEADFLIVAVNSDSSVRKLKGDSRPVNDEQSRALLIASLVIVDAVVIFEEDTPVELIRSVMPDVIVKGGDYTTEQIAGAKEVIANGGRVVINKIIDGYSTTGIIEKLRKG